MHYSRGTLTLLTLLLASQVQAQIDGTNLTLAFSALESRIWGDNSPSFSMWERPKPPYQTCFNLADVFGNTSSFWDYTIEHAEKYNPQANFTTLSYKQLNGTGLAIGEDAARLVKVWPLKDCRESESLPWYGFSCQDNGTSYDIPDGIQSFSILDRAVSGNEEQGHCWTWAIDGRSAASTTFKGCFAAMTAAVLSAIVLVL
ncbi:hypothetical protein KCU78_g5031, partial [Aureobasidium melanogenum]